MFLTKSISAVNTSISVATDLSLRNLQGLPLIHAMEIPQRLVYCHRDRCICHRDLSYQLLANTNHDLVANLYSNWLDLHSMSLYQLFQAF